MATTEQLVDDDGKIDEKAATEAIDAVINEDEAAKQEEGLGEKETTKADDKAPAKEEEATAEDESDSDDWVTNDDIAELVESLGYTDDDMSEFAGPEEFQTHVRLMDREIAKRTTRPGDEQNLALDADELSRQKDARSRQVKDQYRKDGKFAEAPKELPKLDPDEFDERLVEAFEAQQAEIAALREQINGSKEHQMLENFDHLVDKLGHEDLFGNSEDLKASDRIAREKLWEATKTILNGMEAGGQEINGVNRGIIVRALNMEFAETLQKKNRSDLTSKAKRQSARRTGSSNRQATKKYDGPIELSPDLHEAYKQMEAENG